KKAPVVSGNGGSKGGNGVNCRVAVPWPVRSATIPEPAGPLNRPSNRNGALTAPPVNRSGIVNEPVHRASSPAWDGSKPPRGVYVTPVYVMAPGRSPPDQVESRSTVVPTKQSGVAHCIQGQKTPVDEPTPPKVNPWLSNEMGIGPPPIGLYQTKPPDVIWIVSARAGIASTRKANAIPSVLHLPFIVSLSSIAGVRRHAPAAPPDGREPGES